MSTETLSSNRVGEGSGDNSGGGGEEGRMRRKTPTITIMNPEDFAQLLPTVSTNKVSPKNFNFILFTKVYTGEIVHWRSFTKY